MDGAPNGSLFALRHFPVAVKANGLNVESALSKGIINHTPTNSNLGSLGIISKKEFRGLRLIFIRSNRPLVGSVKNVRERIGCIIRGRLDSIGSFRRKNNRKCHIASAGNILKDEVCPCTESTLINRLHINKISILKRTRDKDTNLKREERIVKKLRAYTNVLEHPRLRVRSEIPRLKRNLEIERLSSHRDGLLNRSVCLDSIALGITGANIKDIAIYASRSKGTRRNGHSKCHGYELHEFIRCHCDLSLFAKITCFE